MFKTENYNFVNICLSFTYSSVFLGLMFPYKFPLFSILIFVNSFILIFGFSKSKAVYTGNILLYVFVFYTLLYISSIIIFSIEIFDFYISDLRNSISCLLLLLLSILLVKDLDKFKKLIVTFYKQVFVLSLICSIIGLTKFYLELNGSSIVFFESGGIYPLGTALMNDYNSYSLGLFFGLSIGFTYLNYKLKFHKRLLLWISLLFIVTAIIFSGSRRSIILLSVLLIIFLLRNFRSLVKLVAANLTTMKFNLILFRPLFFITLIIILYFSFFQNIKFEYLNLDVIDKILFRVQSLGSPNESFSQRSVRWDLSSNLTNSMDFNNIIFGNGYNYWSEFVTNNKDLGSDYPHNIFYSTFFANGILGVFLISTLLLFSLISYKKNIIFFPLFIIYSISLLYVFISGDQFFSNKSLILLILIPIIYETKCKNLKTNN